MQNGMNVAIPKVLDLVAGMGILLKANKHKLVPVFQIVYDIRAIHHISFGPEFALR
jgi:hypothetical protein